MTDREREQAAQEVQEYTAEQAAQLKAAAAKISGRPEEALTVEDAESVLFEEIGITIPKTPMQAARQILLTNIAADMQRQQEGEQGLTDKGKGIDLQAIFDAIPAEQAQALKQAAANISGKAIEDLTIEQAMQILERGDPNPAIRAAVDRIAEDAAAQISDEQWEQIAEQLQAAAEAGTLQDAAISLMGQIPQATQEVQEANKERPRVIVIDTGDYDPRLDPNAPEFDIEAYRKAIADAGGMEAMTERLQSRIDTAQKQMQETILEATKAAAPTMQEAIADIFQEAAQNIKIVRDAGTAIISTVQQVFQGIADFVNSDTYKTIKENMAAIASFIAQHSAEIAALSDLAEEIQDLAPFLSIELKEAQQDQAFANYTLQDLLEQGFDADGNPTDSPFRQLIERAKQRQAAFEEAEGTIADIEQAAEELPKLQSLIPVQHTMPNNTLMNDLAGARGKQPINAGAYDLPVIPATKRQREITVYVMADYEPEKGIVSNLTEYERDVSDAIMSIWEQAKREGKPAAFSADSLYRAMPGRGERASPQQKGAITKATEKFLHLYLDIDATDELRKRGVIGAGDTYHVKDYYLRAQEHIYKAKGGQPVRAWLMTGEPLILNYAKRTGQLLTVPAQHLAIEKVKQGRASGELVTMNAPRQAMTSYMLRRIAIMKHDLKRAKEAMRSHNRRRAKDKTLEELPLAAFREQSDTILFDSLFKATGTASTNREVTRRNREFCFDVLDYWIASGYIRGYKKQSKGRSISGVIIEH